MKITEDEIRQITLNAIEKLGEKAFPESVKKVVASEVDKLIEQTVELPGQENKPSGRIILTAFGLNKPGVVASITKIFSDAGCDIHDISQKIMGDFFTMIMIVNISNASLDLRAIQNDLHNLAENLKIKVYIQHEDLFHRMHRI